MTGKENPTHDLHESARNALEAELMQSARKQAPVTAHSANAVEPALAAAAGTSSRQALRHEVLAIISVILKLPVEKIDSEEKISTYGVDSIVITEIMGRIADALGVSLSAAIFFEARNIEELTDIIITRFGQQVAARYDNPSRRSEGRQSPASATKPESGPAAGEKSARSIQALLAKSHQIRQKRQRPVAAPPNGRYEPIAIIGMSGMFAQSSSVEALQRHLYQGRDCISEVPNTRWDWKAVYGNPKDGEFTNVKYAGFIEDVDKFDPGFFGISPREAQTMDPQHRLFIESAWQLIESSGYAPGSLAGKKVGVYAGINLQDYAETVLNAQSRDIVELTAIPHMFCPNRLSYLLDVHGPSEIIDTACSSSLVAIHRAVMSIQHGDCDMAIAGGANLILSPKMHILYSKAEMICEDGRCKTFSEQANGYARGEGVGVVMLKRLADAQADKDNILGVIIGSAENHGGAATSLMAPNPNAQARLIRDAHRRSGVDPRSITYIECHGTGTPLGDPIEVNGLKTAFTHLYQDHGLDSTPAKHCALGSVKSNIGHTETAAGVAGVIKVLLAMRDEYLPKSLHCQQLNPLLELEESPFYVLQEGQTWQRPTIGDAPQPLRAGVSSFGAGGANAHLVIEEYRREPEERAPHANEPEIIVLSAKNSERLQAYAQHLLQYVTQHSAYVATHFKQFAYTLQTARDAMPVRAAFVVDDVASLVRQLTHLAQNAAAAATIFVSDEAVRAAGVDAQDIAQWWQTKRYTEIAQAWAETGLVDWRQLYAGRHYARLALPTYPFDRRRYWIKETQQPPAVVLAAIQPTIEPVKKASHSEKIRLQPLKLKTDAHQEVAKGTEAPPAAAKRVEPPQEHQAINGNGASRSGERALERVIDALRTSLAHALCAGEAEIHVDRPFAEMGLDSIVGAEWVHAINQQLGCALSATRIYDYSNVRQLAQFIVLQSEQGNAAHERAPQIRHASEESAQDDIRSDAGGQSADSRRDSAAIASLLKASLADALYITVDEIQNDRAFAALGLDSIIGAEWIHELNKTLGTELSATRLYDYPTIQVLAEYIATQSHGSTPRPKPKAAVSEPETPCLQDLKPAASAVPAEATAASHRRDEKIAIIGMAGRYPDADNLDQYWDNLANGRNSVREVPGERWNVDQYFDADRSKDGKVYCKWLGALTDIDGFDPLFFSISPAEAEGMDPQHRLFLQEGYKAFEDAGYSPEALSHTKCGVYMGIMSYEYAHLMLNSTRPLSGTGNSFAIGAARIPYFLNLKGPAIPVDTACSSSLVATHLAVTALQNGEIDLALVGGVSLYLMPETYMGMCAAGMLSPEGQCKAFDDAADGFVPGEGAGCLVLKRLSQAEADGDPIHGVIIGSGINQDGKTNGITAPSVNSQIELEREVYRKSQITPDSISYVETHGTGTKLGDPIEFEALTAVFREQTSRKHFCGLGSVKSNIGHASAASGMASVHKTLLSMKHKQLAPSLHFSKPNQHVNFEDSPFYVNTQLKPWRHDERQPRRAAVSAFGYSGTNAHLVIEEYLPSSAAEAAVEKPRMIALSAMRADRLPLMANNLLAWIQRERAAGRAVDLCRLAYTLLQGRQAMTERLAFIVDSVDELQEKLSRFIAGDSATPPFFRGQASGTPPASAPQPRDQDLHALAAEWATGGTLSWERLYSPVHGAERRFPQKISLPTYPFYSQSCWFEGKASVGSPVSLPDAAEENQTGEATSWLRATEDWVDAESSENTPWVERIRANRDRRILVLDQTAADCRAVEQVCLDIQTLTHHPQPIWDVRHIALPKEALTDEAERAALNGALSAAIPHPDTPLTVFLFLPDNPDAGLRLAYLCIQALQAVARVNPLQFYCCHRADYEHGLTTATVQYEALSGLLRSAILETVGHDYRSIVFSRQSAPQETALQLMQTWLYAARPAPETGRQAQALDASTVRFSGGRRYALRVSESDRYEGAGARFRTGATYLMIGALGETGEQFCRALGQHYQAQLVIFSRRPENQVAPILARIRASGARVIYHTVDILDAERVNQTMRTLASEGISLHGVVHLARQVSDGAIVNKPWDAFRQTLAAKVTGTLNIDAATANEPLELFLMFSSVAAFGIQGSSDYAYSAAFQNAFARYRQQRVALKQRRGVTASVCWGQWDVDGAVAPERLPARLAQLAHQGMGSISAPAAVRQLQTGLTEGVTALVAVTDREKARTLLGLTPATAVQAHAVAEAVRQNIHRYRVGELTPAAFADYLSALSLPALPAELQHEVGAAIATALPAPAAENTAIEAGKGAGGTMPRESELRSVLAFGIEKVMKLGDALDWDKPLQDYGMDSIIAMQLSTMLEKQMKFPVQPNWLIDHPTPNLLMKKLREQAGARGNRL